MILFLNDATKYKKLDNFPNGWTGKELIELSEDLKEHGIKFKVDCYAGRPKHVVFCSEDLCFNQNEYTAPDHGGLYFV